jgi:hypothetical protein
MSTCKYLTVTLSLAVLMCLSPSARPQPSEAGKPPADSLQGTEVEVRFVNGSTVLMTLLQERIEVLTPYGKLSVPPQDIRRIEFGVHPTEEVELRIIKALEALSSRAYRQRELAVKELVTLGPQAYLALKRAATTTKDGEAAKRIEIALNRIAQKFPARMLRVKEDDVIHTVKFIIVGRVINPGLRARAEYFGDLNVRPGELLTLRSLRGSGEAELTVDAGLYGSAPNQWLDTGVQVEAHLSLRVVASGQVDLWPQQAGQYMANPDGMPGAVPAGARGRTGPSATAGGTLLGRIGEAGTPFVLGERYARVPHQDGKLYLHIVPSPWNCPSTGSFRVQVSVGSFGEGE